MRAIRAKRLGVYEIHWRADADWTECGRQIKHFTHVDELDLAEIAPHLEACDACAALRAGELRPRKRASDPVYVLPGRGRLFKTGPLYHGPKSQRGGELLP